MNVVGALLDVLETLFVVGAIGSGIVLILTGIEDVRTVLERKQPPAEEPQAPPQ